VTVAAPLGGQERSGSGDDSESAEVPAGQSGVRRSSAIGVLVAGVLGLAAAATLTVEKIEILIDPSYIPSCSLNPVLSCGSVMTTPQASVFGFPNSLLGIIAFTVVLVTGVLTVARVDLPRWYWAALAVGTALGVVFVHWLIFQSLYRIGALCPYCMVVWAVTIPLLAIVTSIALRADTGTGVVGAIYQWRWSLVALWFTAVLLMILVRFWNYWSTLV
jgi:uncharacterized membrane protein